MPNTHLNLVHRIVEVKGSRHNLAKGSTILTEYDVPTNPWYYSQNSSPNIPYSILMEIALQPCGFLSAYLGTTFLYPDEDLYFRNLDGKGTLLKSIDVRGKTITNTATLLSSSSIQGTIIQSFSFQVAYEGEIFYQGEAVFGHFSSDALAKQIGLDRGHNVLPWLEMATNLAPTSIDLDNPIDRHKYYQIQPDRPHYRLAQYQLDLLNEINIIPGGGQYRQGYIYATKYIEPTDWYFRCHFYQDPVMPGSLGLEAMLQAMQAYLLDLDLGKQFPSPQFTPLIDTETTWKYRGQIPYGSEKIFLEIHISKIEITPNRVTAIGDASLWKPSMRIYEVKNLGICLKNYNN
jgi:3-hydroxymyristoyl/3-hydroxydecanoyl-(acyl carrier protein) dehydratase